MKKFKYPALVIKEAKSLRKLATVEERNRLNFQKLDFSSKFECIYGQMTSNCFSKRAKELIEKSCSRVYSTKTGDNWEEYKLNGTPIGKYRKEDGAVNIGFSKERTSYFSPIEVFIARGNNWRSGANERLVKYIKGEIKTL